MNWLILCWFRLFLLELKWTHLTRIQWRNLGSEGAPASPLAKSLRKSNPKIKAFKRVLDWACKIVSQQGRAEAWLKRLGKRQFNYFTRFQILAIKFFSNCFKNVWGKFQIELNVVVFSEKFQKSSSGGSLPSDPYGIRWLGAPPPNSAWDTF